MFREARRVRVPTPIHAIWATLRRFFDDELGVESVQFVLVVPIVLGILWTGFEVWQIVTLRTRVRNTVSEAARYVSAYGALNENLVGEPYYEDGDICNSVRMLVSASLSEGQSTLGSRVLDYTTVRWYAIKDPTDPHWAGNAFETSCLGLLSHLRGTAEGSEPRDFYERGFFGVRIDVTVPWHTVIFGLGGFSDSDFVLRISDTAVGSTTNIPYAQPSAEDISINCDPGGAEGCACEVRWRFDHFSYVPDRVEVFVGEDSAGVFTIAGERPEPVGGWPSIDVPPEGENVEVVFYGDGRRSSAGEYATCGP